MPKPKQDKTDPDLLDEDVARLFPDSKSVNDALRAIAGIIEGHAKTNP